MPHDVDASNHPTRWSEESDGGNMTRGNRAMPDECAKQSSQNCASFLTPGPTNTLV